jgi:maltose O-acetyltransferase
MSGAPSPDDHRTQRERMLAGELYRSDDPELVRAHRRAVGLVDRYNRTAADDPEARRSILGELLGAFGPDSVLRPPIACDYGSNLSIGARTFANFGLVALDAAAIDVGDDVQIGPNVQLLTPTHPLDAGMRRDGWEAAGPISIGDNVWLGGGVIVLADVTIGSDTVVGAGAVVTRDLPSGVLAVGNPARIIRRLGDGSVGQSD